MSTQNRNNSCPCGSGKKYKKCCLGKAATTPGVASPAPAQLIQAALQHHQSGRLSQAETLYKQVLRSNPDNPDALYLLGMLAHQVGNNEVATEIINRAIRVNS